MTTYDDAWIPDPLDGAALLDRLHQALTKYVVLPSVEAADAVVLWIAATHAQPAWEHAPRLAIKSPEKRCGKSRLLDLTEATVYHPLITVNASPAAVYRAIGGDEPRTLLVDEADAIFGTRRAAEANEDLRALLNAGHQRGRPAIRWDAKARKLDECQTFAMAALAGIGDLPDTIEDRAIVVKMRRRAPTETVAAFRSRRDAVPLHDLRDELHSWVRDNLEKLRYAEPVMPAEDRAADTWEPLTAVADLAGGRWPERARQACKVLTALDDTDDGNLKTRLLADCRAAFADEDWPLAIRSESLLEHLKADPEAPWAEYGRAGLSARKLGLMLSDYGISSSNIRFDDKQAKGYLRMKFDDAWSRYCPPEGAQSQASQPSQPRSEPGRIEPWDGYKRPSETSVPGLTSADTEGTDGTEQGQPDKKPLPAFYSLFDDDRYPGRCSSCGFHIETQGHGADCTESKAS